MLAEVGISWEGVLVVLAIIALLMVIFGRR